jgi:hypothetical protein
MKSKLSELVHDLAKKSTRLDRLFADPHPGLYTWNQMVNTAMNETLDAAQALAQFMTGNFPKEDEPRDPVFFGG